MSAAPNDRQVLRRARRTLELEAKAIEAMTRRVGKEFLRAVEIVHDCRAKVILTGVGKSGLVATKIAATLASTGTPAVFVHAAEAAHGDLGVITPEDVVLAVSSSGETDEIKRLIPTLRKTGVRIIAITRMRRSTLARVSDAALLTGTAREACPLGLAPTTSSTAALAMGDALAMALLERRGFREEDFARVHPGGSIGKKWLRVGELMHTGDELPVVAPGTSLVEAIAEMSAKRLGVTAVTDRRGTVLGIVTDGDLRRMIERGVDFAAAQVDEVMTAGPVCAAEEDLAVQSLRMMESRAITSLLVTGPGGRLAGIVHLHDLLKAGIV